MVTGCVALSHFRVHTVAQDEREFTRNLTVSDSFRFIFSLCLRASIVVNMQYCLCFMELTHFSYFVKSSVGGKQTDGRSR